jgi:hypothetical protein
MKLAEFNDLCHREYAKDRGIVTQVSMSGPDHAELSADVLSSADPEKLLAPAPNAVVGACVHFIANPAAAHPVLISSGCMTDVGTGAEIPLPRRAQVMRWVDVPDFPLPPHPASGDTEPSR